MIVNIILHVLVLYTLYVLCMRSARETGATVHPALRAALCASHAREVASGTAMSHYEFCCSAPSRSIICRFARRELTALCYFPHLHAFVPGQPSESATTQETHLRLPKSDAPPQEADKAQGLAQGL